MKKETDGSYTIGGNNYKSINSVKWTKYINSQCGFGSPSSIINFVGTIKSCSLKTDNLFLQIAEID